MMTERMRTYTVVRTASPSEAVGIYADAIMKAVLGLPADRVPTFVALPQLIFDAVEEAHPPVDGVNYRGHPVVAYQTPRGPVMLSVIEDQHSGFLMGSRPLTPCEMGQDSSPFVEVLSEGSLDNI